MASMAIAQVLLMFFYLDNKIPFAAAFFLWTAALAIKKCCTVGYYCFRSSQQNISSILGMFQGSKFRCSKICCAP